MLFTGVEFHSLATIFCRLGTGFCSGRTEFVRRRSKFCRHRSKFCRHPIEVLSSSIKALSSSIKALSSSIKALSSSIKVLSHRSKLCRLRSKFCRIDQNFVALLSKLLLLFPFCSSAEAPALRIARRGAGGCRHRADRGRSTSRAAFRWPRSSATRTAATTRPTSACRSGCTRRSRPQGSGCKRDL